MEIISEAAERESKRKKRRTVIMEFELNVPSGIMVFNDSLYPQFRIFGDYEFCSNVEMFQKKSQAMARIGCAQGYIRNTCPGVYRMGGDLYVVDHREDNHEGELVAGICADAPYYSAVDGDEFERRGCERDYGRDASRVRVKPGVYLFTHRVQCSEGWVLSWINTEIRWVRPPDPAKDFLKEIRETDFTAGQVINRRISNLKKVVELTAPLGDLVQGVANDIFIMIGSDGDWHPNGFIQHDPDMPADEPEVEIPVFDGQHSWDEISDSSAIYKAATGEISLNRSFLALARNVLDCIIRRGDGKIPENVEWAKKCLKGINERYSD